MPSICSTIISVDNGSVISLLANLVMTQFITTAYTRHVCSKHTRLRPASIWIRATPQADAQPCLSA